MFITESIITNVKPVSGQVELGEMRKGEMVKPVSGGSSYSRQVELSLVNIARLKTVRHHCHLV